jgi:hypothetical protein
MNTKNALMLAAIVEAGTGLAMLVHDSKAPVIPVLFTWPSRGELRLRAYTYDRLSELDPEIRRKFRGAAQLLQLRAPYIDETCRRLGRPSPFALERVDDEAIANLPL